MGEAKRKAEAELVRRTVHARKIVAAFETFIDANIQSYMHQFSPETPSPRQDVNTLHDAREALVKVLVVPPSEY